MKDSKRVRRGLLEKVWNWAKRCGGRVLLGVLAGGISWQPWCAEDPVIEAINLPPLEIGGQPARAHTQGLEITSGDFYVTARREDLQPRRALLLRTGRTGTRWDIWDITPTTAEGALTRLDHPGGIQSDGKRLWVPLAESKRHGRSIIRVFAIAGIVRDRPPAAELEFAVDDHIGAIAVSEGRRLVLGASWDTETVYVWDLMGHLQRKLTGAELARRGLGGINGLDARAALAVQDWKFHGETLFASGLVGKASELKSFTNFLDPEFRCWTVSLPTHHQLELAREGMAVRDGEVFFLPEDLGSSNQLFRIRLADLQRVHRESR